MLDKKFIAITSKTFDGKLVYLTTSAGNSLFNKDGIDYVEAIDFFYDLIYKRKRSGGIVFVCYAFQRDNEFIFSTMPRDLKDKLFGSHKVREQRTELEYEIDKLEDDYWRQNKESQEFQLTDFELHVNRAALAELNEIRVGDYFLKLANGKFLTIRKNNTAITIYDVYGFFRTRILRRAVKDFLGKDIAYLDKNKFDFLNFKTASIDFEKLKTHANIEAEYVSKISANLDRRLCDIGIKLRSFYGTGAIASHVLSKTKARSQYHNYAKRRQLAPNLWDALRRATFGGRTEQIKLGTLEDVHIYDINSAYPYAIQKLPVMLQKPLLSREWQDVDFSFWKCDFDFTKADLHIGLLPYRSVNGWTRFPLKGSGWYWQPEIKYVLEHYPECIEIEQGFVHEAEKLDISDMIDHYYDLRLELDKINDPIADVVKLGLSSISGKFFQHNGKGYYYNLFYAGYVTSQTRAQLLETIYGQERDIICFQTDAIHATASLSCPVSDNLGEYKKSTFEKVTYLDNGVYQGYANNRAVKTKTRGFRYFDFARCLKELADTKSYTALSEFFVGHNLFTRHLFTGAPYLSDHGSEKTMTPALKDRIAMRWFENREVDLTQDHLDSFPVNDYNGLMSAPYNGQTNNKVTDVCMDTIMSGRI